MSVLCFIQYSRPYFLKIVPTTPLLYLYQAFQAFFKNQTGHNRFWDAATNKQLSYTFEGCIHQTFASIIASYILFCQPILKPIKFALNLSYFKNQTAYMYVTSGKLLASRPLLQRFEFTTGFSPLPQNSQILPVFQVAIY